MNKLFLIDFVESTTKGYTKKQFTKVSETVKGGEIKVSPFCFVTDFIVYYYGDCFA